MRFEVWTPRAEHGVRISVDGTQVPMEPDGDRGWWAVEWDAAPDSRYSFLVDDGDPRADPRALRLPDGPEGDAQLVDLGRFDWTDHGWRGVPLPGSVIYELHVGTFTPAGTLDAAIERLDHLVELGVDLVEVMPVATFPGRHGWGYDGVGLYAVHEPYGGPEALCRFVDACHARGLGVCLDVVYNHLGPSGNHLQEFGPYFTGRYGTPWGEALNLDDADSDEVRRFIIDNALMWLRDFHVDGLRLDAVHALFDDRAVTLLEELSAEVGALSTRLARPLWLIAESDRNDPLTVTPREAGGLGMHAQWADDVHHALHVLLTGETQGYYEDFAAPGALAKVLGGVFLHDGTYSAFRRRTHGRPVDRARTSGWRFVVSLQTHDQVGNRAVGDRLSAQLSPGLLAAGAALLLSSPGTPMLFMGEEWGATTPWQYFTDHTDTGIARAVRRGRRDEFAAHGWDRSDVPDPQSVETFERSKLDWTEVDQPPQARLLQWYAALIRLRRQRPDLRDPRLADVHVSHDLENGTIVVHRGEHLIAVNLSAQPRDIGFVPITPGAVSVVLAWDTEGTTLVDDTTVRLGAESAVILGPSTRPESSSS
ncbi:MAG: malto-oligosyltrehalose trehalohydrolase [Nocardioidaceae bacterium]